MADGFFKKFLETESPAAPEEPAAGPAQTSPPPQAPTGERAQAPFGEVKGSQYSQGAIEEMFEKLWLKANRERAEEELRLVRERSEDRAELLAARLDEIEKKFLDRLRDDGAKSSRNRDEALQKAGELAARLDRLEGSVRVSGAQLLKEFFESHEYKLMQGQARRDLENLASEEFSRLARKINAGIESSTNEVREGFMAGVEEMIGRRLDAIESAQNSTVSRMIAVEKSWGILFNDAKEMAASMSAMKGAMESVEDGVMIKVRREFDGQVQSFSSQWSERLAALETRILRQAEQFHESSSAQLRGAWAKEIEPARESLLADLRGSMEWQQIRTLWDRVEDLSETVLKFGETATSARTGAHKDLAAVSGEIESLRLQVMTANQAIRHLEESLRMALQMIQAK